MASSQIAHEWVEEVQAELKKLEDCQFGDKKRQTVLAIIQARLQGSSAEGALKRKDTCNRVTYYRWKKEDPIFAEVLDSAWKIAYDYTEKEALRQSAVAALRIKSVAPCAVARALQAMQNPDDRTALQAAFGLLDRGDLATALKQMVVQETDIRDSRQAYDPSKLSAEELEQYIELLSKMENEGHE